MSVAGNVLNVGGDVQRRPQRSRRRDDHGATSDYTSVRAAGDLVLDGELALDVHGALTRGTVLTIMSGTVDHGPFHSAAREARRARGRPPVPGLLRDNKRDADRHAGGAAELMNTR